MGIREELSGFTGTENHYKHMFGFVYTDGIKYLAEKAECYWLLDLVGSYLNVTKDYPFLVWEIVVDKENNSAVITAKEDSNKPDIVRQEIEFTDFFTKTGMEKFRFFLIDNVMLLPSEY